MVLLTIGSHYNFLMPVKVEEAALAHSVLLKQITPFAFKNIEPILLQKNGATVCCYAAQ